MTAGTVGLARLVPAPLATIPLLQLRAVTYLQGRNAPLPPLKGLRELLVDRRHEVNRTSGYERPSSVSVSIPGSP
jgi:hypothetical protein